MAFTNFKPEVWSKQLLLDRDTKCVGIQNSWRAFEGEIKQTGDRVHIQGLGGATIKDLPSNGVLDDPEGIEDSSLVLEITEKKYINFKIDDIDKMQSNTDAMQAVISKTSNNLAVLQDSFVYGLAKATPGLTVDAYSAEANYLSTTNVFNYITNALAFLQTSQIMGPGEVRIELHPYVFQKLQLALLMKTNPNNQDAKNGYQGDIFGCKVFISNAIPVTDGSGNTVAAGSAGAIYHNIIRTGEAVAFAEQKSINFKAYDIEKGFGEGIKGYCLYGGKVVKPKELVVLKSILKAETF